MRSVIVIFCEEWSDTSVQEAIKDYLSFIENETEYAMNHRSLTTAQKDELIFLFSSKKTAAEYMSKLIKEHHKIPIFMLFDSTLESFHEYSQNGSNSKQRKMYAQMCEAINDITSLLM